MSNQLVRWLGAALLAGLLSSPAHAGQYVFDQSNSTASGTFTLTTTDASDWNYPGYSYPMGYPLGVAFSLHKGSVSWNGTATLVFHWQPNMDEETGEPDPNDLPPADGESWEVPVDGVGGLAYPSEQDATEDGTGTFDWSVSCDGASSTFHQDGSGTANTWTYDSNYNMVQTRSYSPLVLSQNGDPDPALGFLLTGTDPTITLTFTGSGNVTGSMQLGPEVLQGQPRRAQEAIRHTTPANSSLVHNGDVITPAGWWQGRTDRNYQVALSWTGPHDGGGPWYSTPFTAGTGGHVPWTSGLPFTIQGGPGSSYSSTATLYYQVNATTGRPTRASHTVQVNVSF